VIHQKAAGSGALGLKPALLALFINVLWGGINVSIKVSLGGLPPLAIAGIRFAVATLVLGIWARISGERLGISRRDALPLFLLSLVFVVQIWLMNLGTGFTLASRATLFISTSPFFTVILADRFVSGDKVSLAKIAGITVAFSGVLLVFGEGLARNDIKYLLGDLVILVSSVTLGLRNIFTKRLVETIPAIKLVFWQGLVAVPLFLLLSGLMERNATYTFSPAVLLSLAYQAIVIGVFCFVVQTKLIEKYRVSAVSAFASFTPISGAFLSVIVLGERLSPMILLAALLVGAGVFLVNREPKRRPEA
jgi:drug/metabolite transporter (DMT)-like permease